MNIKTVKEWRDNAEVMGEIKYSDEVNWLIRRVETLEAALKPEYVEPDPTGGTSDLVMSRAVKKHVLTLRRELETTKIEMDMKVTSLNIGVDLLLDRCKYLEKKLADSV